jgi:hypothetical protein
MISRRAFEAATATLTGAFGAAVAISSLSNGIGWSSAGVDAGTFPFITGLIILCGSVCNLLRGVLADHERMLDWSELKRLGALFIPAAIYVGAIPLAGMYVASAGYVFGTFAVQSRVSLARSLLAGAITAAALYLVFERMFEVSLPRGLLGEAAGF